MFRYGPGSYILSSVKNLFTSEDFDTLDPQIQNCQFEQTWADCWKEKFIEQVIFSENQFIDKIYHNTPGHCKMSMLSSKFGQT